jgi:hypothetical protein
MGSNVITQRHWERQPRFTGGGGKDQRAGSGVAGRGLNEPQRNEEITAREGEVAGRARRTLSRAPGSDAAPGRLRRRGC